MKKKKTLRNVVELFDDDELFMVYICDRNYNSNIKILNCFDETYDGFKPKHLKDLKYAIEQYLDYDICRVTSSIYCNSCFEDLSATYSYIEVSIIDKN
jgi:hypothetical protein